MVCGANADEKAFLLDTSPSIKHDLTSSISRSIDCSRLSIILLAYFKDVNKLMYLADHMACVIAD